MVKTLLQHKKIIGLLLVCSLFGGVALYYRPQPTHFPQASVNQTPPDAHLLAILPHTYYVAPAGSDANDGATMDQPFQTIQHALQVVQPGDTVYLAAGDYREEVSTQRDGEPNAPITLLGPTAAVLHGVGKTSIAFLVNHSYYTLVGFTIDGLHGDPTKVKGYTDKLLYVQGHQPRKGVTGLHVLHMTFKNAGGECVRLRYFAQHNEIAYSTILNCGRMDFQFASEGKNSEGKNSEGKNGEGIYVGTSSTQWHDGKNPTADPDETTDNWIHHNVINTQGSECVDIKEGAHNNLVEYNNCTGQRDPNGGGLDARGDNNIFRFNLVYDNLGVGIRLGGHKVDGVEYGKNNEVYNNALAHNQGGGVNIVVGPQVSICGNALNRTIGKTVLGAYASKYDPGIACKNS